ncbi:hypothetical protein QJQ45_024394, partial [Haematococcus lacustris]
LVKAMVDKKRGVKANCANVQKAREVTAQRRAAEAAGPIEIGAQAGVIAAEAQAQAVAGAQLHQLQADLQHRELQLAHNQRMQQLQQQLQDLQRSELQRKEQQLADLVAQQRAALLQWEHQLTQRQHQLQQQQVDLSRREQDLTERKHQLQQQQAHLDSREQQQARTQTLTQQLHSLQQQLKAQQVAQHQQMEKQPLAYLQAISNNHPLPDPSPCSRTRMPVNHPHLKNPAARNEPNAKRCALCELTSPAKNKDGFVVVEKVGEDACHGRYLVVFGRASVLKGSVLLVVFFGTAGIGTRGGWGADAVLRACCKVVCRPRGAGQRRGRVVLVDEHRTTWVSSAVNGKQPCEEELNHDQPTRHPGWKPPAGQVDLRLLRPAWSQQRDQPVRGLMGCPVVGPRKAPQPLCSSQEATPAAASEPGPSTPPPAKRSKRTKTEQAAEPTQPTKGKGKGKGKAAKAKPTPQPGRWLDRDCNAVLNMQRVGESRWRPLELCYWPDQGAHRLHIGICNDDHDNEPPQSQAGALHPARCVMRTEAEQLAKALVKAARAAP